MESVKYKKAKGFEARLLKVLSEHILATPRFEALQEQVATDTFSRMRNYVICNTDADEQKILKKYDIPPSYAGAGAWLGHHVDIPYVLWGPTQEEQEATYRSFFHDADIQLSRIVDRTIKSAASIINMRRKQINNCANGEDLVRVFPEIPEDFVKRLRLYDPIFS